MKVTSQKGEALVVDVLLSCALAYSAFFVWRVIDYHTYR